MEETDETAEMEQMSDVAFDKELENLMEEENTGKKKKKKGSRKKWSKKRKIITIGAVAIGAFFIAFKVLAGGGGVALPVTVSPLAKGEVVDMLSVSGPVQGTDSVEVVSNLHAEILELPVKEGDRVEKGQVMAVLDDKDAKKEVAIAQNA